LLDHDCPAAGEAFQTVAATVKASSIGRASMAIPRIWMNQCDFLRLSQLGASGHAFYSRTAKIT
jgi:hypothetical protein